MTPMSHLNALIAAGWGEVPQPKIPADWRDRKGPQPSTSAEYGWLGAAALARIRKRRKTLRPGNYLNPTALAALNAAIAYLREHPAP
jgi:hypothetical protein